jgi:hypothetical protein
MQLTNSLILWTLHWRVIAGSACPQVLSNSSNPGKPLKPEWAWNFSQLYQYKTQSKKYTAISEGP